MPRLYEAKKDVVSCEKRRVVANELWSGDVRMGEPSGLKARYHTKCEANWGNWNILVPQGRENKSDSVSSGERKRRSPNLCCLCSIGVIGLRYLSINWIRTWLESQTIEGDSPVLVRLWLVAVSWVARSTRNSAWISEDHLVRLNTP